MDCKVLSLEERDLEKVLTDIINTVPKGEEYECFRKKLTYHLKLVKNFTPPELINNEWNSVHRLIMGELFTNYCHFIEIEDIEEDWQNKVRKIWIGELENDEKM